MDCPIGNALAKSDSHLQFPQNRVADHKHWNPVMDKRSDMLELTRRTFCYGQTLDELTKNGFRMEAAPA
jgi:hypothetical protein